MMEYIGYLGLPKAVCLSRFRLCVRNRNGSAAPGIKTIYAARRRRRLFTVFSPWHPIIVLFESEESDQ